MESLVTDHSEDGLDAYQFVFGSERVEASREFADYAREAFPPGRPLLEAIFDLMRKIHRDFPSIRRRPRSRRQSKRSSKNAVAYARTSLICRLLASDRCACQPAISAAIYGRSDRLACHAWWARMRHMPGVRRGAQAPGGPISIPRTIACPRTVTSRWHGGVTIATSAPSMAFSWAVRSIHCTWEWMLCRFNRDQEFGLRELRSEEFLIAQVHHFRVPLIQRQSPNRRADHISG